MSDENVLERLARLEEQLRALVFRLEGLEGDRAKFIWLIVGGVLTGLLSMVVVAGR